MPDKIVVLSLRHYSARMNAAMIAELEALGFNDVDVNLFMHGHEPSVPISDEMRRQMIVEPKERYYDEPVQEPREFERRPNNNPRSFRETRRRGKRR